MIIDDLTPTISDNLTDEIPVEQGTATLKSTWGKALNLFASGASTPLMDGTASTGSANALSRSDHIHPTDTSRASQSDMTAVQTDIGDMVLTTTATDLTGAVNELDADKQDTLVSGTNIKTIGGESILGSGNIFVGDLFVIEEKSIDNISVSANTTDAENIDVTKSGYTALGVVGFVIANASSSGSNAGNMAVRTARLSDATTGQMAVRNVGSTAAKIKMTLSVLYVKS